MILASVLAVLAVAAVAVAGPVLAQGLLPPGWAVWLVGTTVITAAGSSLFLLGVVTFLGLGQVGEVAAHGRWSPTALAVLDPISREVSIAAGLALLPLAAWTLRTMWTQSRRVWAWYRIERDLPEPSTVVSVLETGDVDAFTLPSGRIVMTRGMVIMLTPEQREIVLAHERSHQVHRHAWWCLAVELAAAINPLLRRTAGALADATERWADEDAARVADRRGVAATIGEVALLRGRRRRGAATAATGGRVPQRVAALLAPAPRARPVHLLLGAVLLVAILTTTVAVERAGETLFEDATPVAASGE